MYCLASLPAPPRPHRYTLPLHDALPICALERQRNLRRDRMGALRGEVVAPGILRSLGKLAASGEARLSPAPQRSEEHTSELQSHLNLVCRFVLDKIQLGSELLLCSRVST